MNPNILKGFRDFTGQEAEKRVLIKEIIQDIFEKYGFNPAETPIIEYEKFVKGKNERDEAVSDIYKLKDKGKRKLALRYEFTFQLKRLIKNKKLPFKRYQIGEVFRDEPVSANRLRQFTQCDVDIIGSTIKDEAEILALTNKVLNKLNIKFVIYFNNRKILNEILDEFNIKEKDKQQVMREIDKLDKLSEKEIAKNLRKFSAEKILGIFKKSESYFKKYKSYSEIERLKKYCEYYNVKIKFLPSLARGLSYYNGTVFEVKTEKMKETICAGGSYIINDAQATGITFGLDRLATLTDVKSKKDKILIVSLEQDKKSIKLAQKLRKQKKNVSIYYGKPSKALEYANSYNIGKVIFIGKEEVKKGRFKVKDMRSGKEKFEKF